MAQLTPWLIPKFYAADGTTPLAGGKVFTYEANSSTDKPTFDSQAGTSANTNPIILDANGEADIWLEGGSYKFVISPSTDTDPPQSPIKTIDYINESGGDDIGVVSTITALKALEEGEFEGVNVLGYYAAGDGGGGFYRWNSARATSEANDGTIIAPKVTDNGGTWDRLKQGPVSVKVFGAKGDGSWDDTTHFQSAFAAEKEIYIPPTTTFYKISTLGSGNSIDLIEGQYITGDGPTSLVKCVTTDGNVKVFLGVGISNVTIENIGLQGSNSFSTEAATTHEGIRFDTYDDVTAAGVASFDNISIRNCYINGFSSGISFRAVAPHTADTFDVTGCIITQCYRQAITVRGSSYFNIENNIITDCSPKDGTNLSPAIEVVSQGNDGVSNFSAYFNIVGNNLTNCGYAGMSLEYVEYGNVTGNTIDVGSTTDGNDGIFYDGNMGNVSGNFINGYRRQIGVFSTRLSELTGSATSAGSSTDLISTSTNFLTAQIPLSGRVIQAGDNVLNLTDGSAATISSITDADNLVTTALTGGVDNTWSSGDDFLFSLSTVGSTDKRNVGGNTVSGNTCRYATDNAGDPAVGITAGETSAITGNTIYHSEGYGIQLGNQCTVSGNTVFFTYTVGIYSTGSRNIITGNKLVDCAARGIYINGGTDTLIIGNHIRDSRSTPVMLFGVQTNNATDVYLENNVVQNYLTDDYSNVSPTNVYLHGIQYDTTLSANVLKYTIENQNIFSVLSTGLSIGPDTVAWAKCHIADTGVSIRDSGYTNAASRPSVAASTTIGDSEIRGHGASQSADSGFLRLRSGGNTGGAGQSAWIDISGNSSVTDMDRNVVIGAGAERKRYGRTQSQQGPGTKNDGWIEEYAAEVQTTDAVITTLKTLTLEDENTYHIRAVVTGVKSDGSDRASYELIGTFYRTGAGSATLQGALTTVHAVESDGNWNATMSVTGNNVLLTVQGVAATTVEWSGTLSYLNQSN